MWRRLKHGGTRCEAPEPEWRTSELQFRCSKSMTPELGMSSAERAGMHAAIVGYKMPRTFVTVSLCRACWSGVARDLELMDYTEFSCPSAYRGCPCERSQWLSRRDETVHPQVFDDLSVVIGRMGHGSDDQADPRRRR